MNKNETGAPESWLGPSGLYILDDDHSILPAKSLVEWSQFMADTDRRVAESTIGPWEVSTIFLGMDHNFDKKSSTPLLFETKVSRNRPIEEGELYIIDASGREDIQEHCSTWSQAEAQHQLIVAKVRDRTAHSLLHRGSRE